MVASQYHTAQMGDDQSHETYHTDECDTHGCEYRCQDEHPAVEHPHVESHLTGLILTQQHQVQLLGPYQRDQGQEQGQTEHDTDLGPGYLSE